MKVATYFTALIGLTFVQSFQKVAIQPISIVVDDNTCPSVDIREESKRILRQRVLDVIQNTSVADPEQPCGPGEWYQVAHLNMSDISQQCPSAWREYNTSGVRACGRPTTDIGSCPATFYPTGRQYNKVCGRIIGYQLASPGAFRIYIAPDSIDDIYVDGVSVTYGMPRMHIWTYAAGITEGQSTYDHRSDCPCSLNDSLSSFREYPPDFVGTNYYCESGNINPTGFYNYIPGHLYAEDPVWDGQHCEGTCCSNGKSPPWFSVELPNPTSDNIEVRICGDQDTTDEDTPIALLELYVQ